MMSAFHSILKGFGSVATAMGIARLSVFLNLAILARLLGAEDLGLYSAVWATIGLLVTVSLFGIHTATARIVTAYRLRQRELVGGLLFNVLFLSVSVSLALAAVVTMLIGPLAETFVQTAGFADLIYLVVWNVPLLTLVLIGNAGLQGMEDFRSYSASLICSAALLVPLSYSLARLGGLRGALWATIVTNLLAAVLTFWLLHRSLRRDGLRWSCRITAPLLGEIVSFSLPLFLASSVVLPCWWFASLYLARLHGFAQVGLLAAGLAVFQLLQFLPGALNLPTLPALTRFAEQDTENFSRLPDYNFRLVWIFSLPLVAVTWALAKPLAVTVFGATFASASSVLLWMALAGLCAAVSLTFASVLISAARVWAAFGLNFSWLVLFLVFLALLAPDRGALGVAQAAFFSYLLYSIPLWWYCASRLGISFAALPRLLVTGGVILLVAWFLQPRLAELGPVETALAGALGLFLGLVSTGFWVLVPEERQYLREQLAHSLRGFSRA